MRICPLHIDSGSGKYNELVDAVMHVYSAVIYLADLKSTKNTRWAFSAYTCSFIYQSLVHRHLVCGSTLLSAF